jgi:ferritin-like metal-binding protein YciE
VQSILHAILVAELVDHDGWTMLITLAEKMGKDEFAESFREALAEEDEHLASVRAWVEAHTASQAG